MKDRRRKHSGSSRYTREERSEVAKALICKAYGDPSQLAYEEILSPVLGPGDVRISVQAIGVNRVLALSEKVVLTTRYWQEEEYLA